MSARRARAFDARPHEDALRERIDRLDVLIGGALAERSRIAERIGRARTDAGGEPRDKYREAFVLARMLDAHDLAGGLYPEETLREMYRLLFSAAPALRSPDA